MKKRLISLILAWSFLLPVSGAALRAKALEGGPKTSREVLAEMRWGVNLADLYLADVARPEGSTTGYYSLNAPFGLAMWFWNGGFEWLAFHEPHDGSFSVEAEVPAFSEDQQREEWTGTFTLGVLTDTQDRELQISLSGSRLVFPDGSEEPLSFMDRAYDLFTSNGPDTNGWYNCFLDFDKDQLPQPELFPDGARFQTTVTVDSAQALSGAEKAQFFYQFEREKIDREVLTDLFLDQGANVFRLPVTWTPFVDNETYEIDRAWLESVRTEVDYILSQGAYCILDTHNDYLQRSYVDGQWRGNWMDEEYRQEVDARFTAIWTQIAGFFKDYPQTLILEPCNEPTADGEIAWTEYEQKLKRVNELNDLFVQTVRATGGNNETRLLCLAVGQYNQAEWLKDLDLSHLKDDPYLMVQVHAYYAMEQNSNDPPSENFDYRAATDALFQTIAEFQEETNVPVIMGETGITHSCSDSEQAPKVSYFFQKARETGVPCLWWEDFFYVGDNSCYWLYDKIRGEWGRPEILRAIRNAAGVPSLTVHVLVNGETRNFESAFDGDCTVYAAVYGSDGKLLEAVSAGRESSASGITLELTLSNLPRDFSTKVFLTDGANRPLDPAREVL